MKFEIIVLIIGGILYLGFFYLTRKLKNHKYKTQIGLSIAVIGLIFVITRRICLDDRSVFNIISIFLFSFPIVFNICLALYRRFNQKQ